MLMKSERMLKRHYALRAARKLRVKACSSVLSSPMLCTALIYAWKQFMKSKWLIHGGK